MNCAICGAEHRASPGGRKATPAEEQPCPYQGVQYMELRAGHDQIYFERWRRMDATSIDVRKAYHRLKRLLDRITVVLETEDLPAARMDLGKAFEALHTAGPDEDWPEALLYMDHALSYAHRVIGDLLHEKGQPPHSPADFADWYDAREIPFRQDW